MDMTIKEFKKYIKDLEKQIHIALNPVISKIEIPLEMNISDIHLSFLDRIIDDDKKGYLLGQVIVSAQLEINDPYTKTFDFKEK